MLSFPHVPEDSMGSDEAWEKATDGLRGALEDMGIDYVVKRGRRSVLRSENRLPSSGLHRKNMAVRNYPA